MRLLAIRKLADGTTRLSFDQDGLVTEIVADYVVLALPFAVLRTLDFRLAGFDARKRMAIHQLGRGQNGKLQLQFTSRPWRNLANIPSNGSSYSDTGAQSTWEVTRAQLGASGILNDYTGGVGTRQLRTTVPFAFSVHPGVQRDATNFLKRIAPVFPGLTPAWNSKATSSIPHLSPNLHCAYSYWKVGQYQTIAGYERVPQGNIFFAGEHTSIDFQGFMEGGAAEGARAGGEVLDRLGVAH
jgi:monoamine oxidase